PQDLHHSPTRRSSDLKTRLHQLAAVRNRSRGHSKLNICHTDALSKRSRSRLHLHPRPTPRTERSGGLTRERGTRLLPKPKAPKPLIQLLLTQAQANLSGTDVRRLSQNLRDWEPPCRVRVTNGDVVDLHGALLTKELLRRLQCFCFKTGCDRED